MFLSFLKTLFVKKSWHFISYNRTNGLEKFFYDTWVLLDIFIIFWFSILNLGRFTLAKAPTPRACAIFLLNIFGKTIFRFYREFIIWLLDRIGAFKQTIKRQCVWLNRSEIKESTQTSETATAQRRYILPRAEVTWTRCGGCWDTAPTWWWTNTERVPLMTRQKIIKWRWAKTLVATGIGVATVAGNRVTKIIVLDEPAYRHHHNFYSINL